jgi:2-hydroxy-6-oxonona-2,4-dienedioate hydrolase
MNSIWTDLMGVDFRQTYYDVAGIKTRVLEAGSGPALIFLHGTGGHAEAYARNIEEHAKHFHVYAFDMIGHGYTDRPDCDYQIDDFVEHLINFLDTLGVEKAYLSGESLGAMVASWAAIKHPERVIKLVQNTGILMPPNGEGKVELADALERSRKAAGQLTKDIVRARMSWLMAEPEKTLTDEIINVRYAIYAQAGMLPVMGKIANTILGGVINDDWCEKWVNPELMQKIQCPTLVLWTKHNPGQPVALAKEGMKMIPDARMVVLEHSAHWPQWEEPELFNKLHLEFLLE